MDAKAEGEALKVKLAETERTNIILEKEEYKVLINKKNWIGILNFGNNNDMMMLLGKKHFEKLTKRV